MSVSVEAQKFLEAPMAVGFLFLLTPLETFVFEGTLAVIADEALWVKVPSHCSDCPSPALVPAYVAVEHGPVRLVNISHLFQEGSSEHLRHVLFLKLLVYVTQATRKSGTAVAKLNVSLGHFPVAIQALLQIVKLFGGVVGLCGHGAVVPDGFRLGRRGWWGGLPRRRGSLDGIAVLPQAET